MGAYIRAIEYYLPDNILTNEQLATAFPEWSADKIEQKLGIVERHIAAQGETSSSMAVAAAEKLFTSGMAPEDIDYIVLCTQSPDYLLPTTACIVQDKLGIPTSAGAVDINLGCSGFVYGLGLAKGLIETDQASRVLLITSEMYSRYVHAEDKSVRTLFGDAAAATIVEASASVPVAIGPFVYGTDGRGADNLIVPTGGQKRHWQEGAELLEDEQGSRRTINNLYMNGAEIFNFTLLTVPASVQRTLEKAGKTAEDIDLFVFHQANSYMLEHLRRKMHIPAQKFYVGMAHCGNTVSSTIPIALKDAADTGRLSSGDHVLVVGFGVGYSWASAIIRWHGDD